MSDAKGVDAVERALKVLDAFGPDTRALSLADLARHTGLYKSTILRLAVSLEKFGYLVRGDTGKFRLGPTVWRLGAAYRVTFDLGDFVRPELKRLSEETHETASFYIREGSSRICLYRVEPTRAIRHAIEEGARMPLERGASGKVLTAFSEDILDKGDEVRLAGYAVSLGERDPDVAALAVPIFAGSGEFVGALSVSGPISRFAEDRRAVMIEALRRCQTRLNRQVSDVPQN